MKLAKILLLSTLLAVAMTSDVEWGYPEEEDVIVLTDKIFKEATEKFEFLLVEFYAPWCGHCKKLAPEYAQAAKELKALENPIPIAKLDATENAESAKAHGVKGYPTLKFFINGSPIDYNGGRTKADIVNWIKKKTGPPSHVIKDAEDLAAQIKANKVLVVFYGSEDSAEYKQFVSTALTLDAVAFAHQTDAALLEANGGNSFTVHTQHDNGTHHHSGEATKEAYLAHIADVRFPLVMDFEGDEAIERVFGSEHPAIVLFSDSDHEFTSGGFSEVALAEKNSGNKQGILFFSSKITSGLGQRLSEYIGVSATSAPAVWIIHPANKDLSKYPYSGELTVAGITQFLADWRSNSLEKHYKSEEIPEKNDEPVKVIVGKNFDDLVINNDKYVLVEYYAPWCGHCKALAPIYDEVAKSLASNDKLVLAKCDSTANEIPGVNIQGFPTLKFYAPGKKSSPIDFSGDRTAEGITKFLKEQLGDDWQEAETDL